MIDYVLAMTSPIWVTALFAGIMYVGFKLGDWLFGEW